MPVLEPGLFAQAEVAELYAKAAALACVPAVVARPRRVLVAAAGVIEAATIAAIAATKAADLSPARWPAQ